ncbi:hypothetical protein [Spirosoma agri]|uniref:Uncharacterized protein n=1 Tax=Spirosoma agri TaxID=1987381 RepID=A0A6M0IHM6_9BACT|nr:hypothetical protein [Spirosoma agri]NEU67779.1 hypothetical protein [Spirosoma agri]
MGAVRRKISKDFDIDNLPVTERIVELSRELTSLGFIKRAIATLLSFLLALPKPSLIGAFGIAMLAYTYNPTDDYLRYGAIIGSIVGLIFGAINQLSSSGKPSKQQPDN